MIQGSHNSLSYLKPKHWWLYPFRFMAKCQSLNVLEQYRKGTRVFDFRLYINNDTPIVCHGLMLFKITTSELFYILNDLNAKAKDEIIWIRVINEKNKNKEQFIKFCKYIKKECPNIKFYGGINKKDWKELFNFGYGIPNIIDKYASWNLDFKFRGSGWLLDDLWPWIYAKLNNKKWKNKYNKSNVYLMQDFIEI